MKKLVYRLIGFLIALVVSYAASPALGAGYQLSFGWPSAQDFAASSGCDEVAQHDPIQGVPLAFKRPAGCGGVYINTTAYLIDLVFYVIVVMLLIRLSSWGWRRMRHHE